jgi:hypothetical protein
LVSREKKGIIGGGGKFLGRFLSKRFLVIDTFFFQMIFSNRVFKSAYNTTQACMFVIDILQHSEA